MVVLGKSRCANSAVKFRRRRQNCKDGALGAEEWLERYMVKKAVVLSVRESAA